MDVEHNLSPNTASISKIADENCSIVEAKNALVLPPFSTSASNRKTPIGPFTPESSRENGEQFRDLSSPLTSISSPLHVFRFETDHADPSPSPDGDDSQTPQKSVFDPFAPGPDKLMLAPRRCKYVEASRSSVARRLTFPCTSNFVPVVSHESGKETTADEDNLFASMYNIILDVIASEQTKELVSDSDVFTTPESAPGLSWVAETCPRAPMKSIRKYRIFDKEVSRKLEF